MDEETFRKNKMIAEFDGYNDYFHHSIAYYQLEWYENRSKKEKHLSKVEYYKYLMWPDNPPVMHHGKYWNPNGGLLDLRNSKYHYSFGSIMPVVEKIEEMGFGFLIYKNSCSITQDNTNDFWKIDKQGTTKPEAIYKTVVEFIQQYNDGIIVEEN